MGMSASQMRYCMIAGKKSDVEFQGQQINQQRTTLATQTSAYNNQLLDLNVPTPPSTADYTKTSYTFSSNGETRTVTGTQYESNAYYIDANGVIQQGTNPSGTTYPAGTYVVNYTTTSKTSKGESQGTSVFTNTGTTAAPVYTTSNGTILSLVSSAEGAAEYATDLSNLSLISKDCGLADDAGRAYGSAGYTTPAFYKYTDNGTTKYMLARDLAANANTSTNQSNTAISTYDVNPSAEVTNSAKLGGAKVDWSDSGRMTSITDASGHDYTLSVDTEDDENAYKDAYNEYEYQKAQYDHEIEGINAKISVIQSEDKKLELKLQDLDTQQQALSTEMDSVKKVIDKNIESSFKAFA